MRTGVHDKKWNALQLVPKLRNWGTSLVTVSFYLCFHFWLLVLLSFPHVLIFFFSYMEGHVNNDTPNQRIGITSINVRLLRHQCHSLVSVQIEQILSGFCQMKRMLFAIIQPGQKRCLIGDKNREKFKSVYFLAFPSLS
jgi:hypothetical protein